MQTEELLAVMILRGSAEAGQDIEHCLQLAVLGTIDLDDVWKAHLIHHDLDRELVDSEAKELICLVVVKFRTNWSRLVIRESGTAAVSSPSL